MSLNFDISKIENYDENFPATESGEWNWTTYAVVHRMMHTGLGWELTEKNAAEFYARCILCDKLSGPLLVDGDGNPKPLTPDDIRRHIGLHVNVAPEARSKFIKRWIDIEFTKSLSEYNRTTEVVG